jgi:hypothetical protein
VHTGEVSASDRPKPNVPQLEQAAAG